MSVSIRHYYANLKPRFEYSLLLLLVLTVIAFLSFVKLELRLAFHPHRHFIDVAVIPSYPPLQAQPESAFVVGSIIGQPPQTRYYDFVLALAQGAPDGIERTMLVVNGVYPGPTIEANQADRLVVRVQNYLPNATTIHWHGLFQNGTNYYDGTASITQCGIPPGQSFTYNFTFGEFSGTTWWHSHSTQYTDGVTGALIVHPTSSSSPDLNFPAWAEDRVVQLSDWYHEMSESLLVDYFSLAGVAGMQGNEPIPDSGTINGIGQFANSDPKASYFKFNFERHKTYRLRLINTGSFASIRFSIDHHPFTLIEADGILLQPVLVSSVTLTVAQRYSVLVHANATASPNGLYWMRAEVLEDMFRYEKRERNGDIRGIIEYADVSSPGLPGPPDAPGPGFGKDYDHAIDVNGRTILYPLVLDPPPPEAASVYQIKLSFQKIYTGVVLGFMNSTSWEPLDYTSSLLAVRSDPKGFAMEGASINQEQFMITKDKIEVIDLRVDNLDDGDHPFHIHGLRPWIVGSGPGRYIGQPLDSPNPLRRDTFLVPAYSWFVMRLVIDNPGVWAFHCHLSWHVAAGLLMQINALPSTVARWDFPDDVVQQCDASVGATTYAPRRIWR